VAGVESGTLCYGDGAQGMATASGGRSGGSYIGHRRTPGKPYGQSPIGVLKNESAVGALSAM
jgi:hypothetical protein